MRSVTGFIAIVAALLVLAWAIVIGLSPRDRRPVVACAPVHWTIGLVQRWVIALRGPEVQVQSGQHGTRTAQDSATLWCLHTVDRFVRQRPATEPSR